MQKLTQKQRELIYQTVMLNDKKIVLLLDKYRVRNDEDLDLNANIYCIDDSFNIIWHIEVESTKFKQDPFTSIRQGEDGEIYAKKFSGFKYKIDTETGKATKIGWDK